MKQIIIKREISTIDHNSLRSLMNTSKTYSENKIKTAHTFQFIGKFKSHYKVQQNILFLLLQ